MSGKELVQDNFPAISWKPIPKDQGLCEMIWNVERMVL